MRRTPPVTGLPHVGQLHPSVPLHAIGRALSQFYEDLLAEGVPENLAGLVRQVERDAQARSGHRRAALVVEDDADVRALAETLLEETNLDVVGCGSAEEALRLLKDRDGRVAFVFADVRLDGDMDGLALARSIAVRWPDIRVVVTSGLGEVPSAELPAGVTFMPKPWRAITLLMEAERATSVRQAV